MSNFYIAIILMFFENCHGSVACTKLQHIPEIEILTSKYMFD